MYLRLVKFEKKIIDSPMFLLGIMILSFCLLIFLMKLIRVDKYIVYEAMLCVEKDSFYVQLLCDSIEEIDKVVWYIERENNHYEAVIKKRYGNYLEILFNPVDIYSEELVKDKNVYIVVYGDSISLWNRVKIDLSNNIEIR